MLRVQQYGWTPQRITALACFAVLACYATGYALAGALSGPALRGLQVTNIGTAYVIIAALLVLFSPIADPARISVADQVSRLRSGQTPPDKMDFRFLRFDSGRFGKDALERLAREIEGPQAVVIAQRARDALAAQYRYQPSVAVVPTPQFKATAQTRAANISVVQPAGGTLPDSFLQQEWTSTPTQPIPSCLFSYQKCEAVMIDLDDDGRPELLLFNLPGGTGTATAFRAKEGGKTWSVMGIIWNGHCQGVGEALRAGRFETVANPLKEIAVAGLRLKIYMAACQR